MKLSKKVSICILINILIFVVFSMPAVAAAKTSKDPIVKVKVGYYDENELFQKGSNSRERKSGYAYEFYQEIAKYYSWKYEYVYGDYEYIYSQLLDGDIDVVAGIKKTPETEKDVIFPNEPMLQLDDEEFYFAINSSRTDLVSNFNNAQRKIKLDSPFFSTNLMQKYYGDLSKTDIMSKREQAWLNMRKKITVGYVKDTMPISGQTKDGRPDGIAAYVIDYLKKTLNIQVDTVCYDDISQATEGLRRNEVDAIFPMYADSWIAEQQGVYVTDSVVSDKVMLLFQGEYSDEVFYKIASGNRTIGQMYYIREHYPGSIVVFYNTRKEYLDAVLNGEANCAIAAASVLNRYISSHQEYGGLKVAYLDGSEDFGMAINRNQSILNQIMNKAIRNIPSSSVTEAMIRYSNVEPEYSFKEFLTTHPYEIIGGLLSVMALLLFGCYFYFKRILKHSLEVNKAWAETQKVNDSKNEFVRNLTQDIKDSVNDISDILVQEEKMDSDGPERNTYHNSIKKSIENMKILIADANEISKLECGDIQLAEESFDLGSIIDSTYNGFLRMAGDAEITLTKSSECPAVYPRLIGSPTHVRRILNQIIGNAIKYNDKNGRVTISIEEAKKGYGKISYRFVVEDNGIGMSPEFLPHIFDSFSQEHNGTKAKEYGTGLGLAITKILVEKMGGSIQAESKPGVGSRFEILIPFKIDTEYKKNMAAQAEMHQYLSGKNVLLVEDDKNIVQTISKILTNYEMNVTVADNGKSGAELFESNLPGKFDVILMDVTMPIMDGIEATRYIRKLPRLDAKGIPIIAVTIHSLDEDIRRCLDAGMNAHVAKPVEADKLFSEIAAVVM